METLSLDSRDNNKKFNTAKRKLIFSDLAREKDSKSVVEEISPCEEQVVDIENQAPLKVQFDDDTTTIEVKNVKFATVKRVQQLINEERYLPVSTSQKTTFDTTKNVYPSSSTSISSRPTTTAGQDWAAREMSKFNTISALSDNMRKRHKMMKGIFESLSSSSSTSTSSRTGSAGLFDDGSSTTIVPVESILTPEQKAQIEKLEKQDPNWFSIYPDQNSIQYLPTAANTTGDSCSTSETTLQSPLQTPQISSSKTTSSSIKSIPPPPPPPVTTEMKKPESTSKQTTEKSHHSNLLEKGKNWFKTLGRKAGRNTLKLQLQQEQSDKLAALGVKQNLKSMWTGTVKLISRATGKLNLNMVNPTSTNGNNFDSSTFSPGSRISASSSSESKKTPVRDPNCCSEESEFLASLMETNLKLQRLKKSNVTQRMTLSEVMEQFNNKKEAL